MYAKPPEGTVVTVTTRYQNYYYLARQRYAYSRYENVRVLSYSDNLLGPNDMKVEWDNKDGFTIINLNNVSELIVGNSAVKQVTEKNVHRTVQVEGSQGRSYTILIKDDIPISCTCPQNTFRKQKCKHMLAIEASIG